MGDQSVTLPPDSTGKKVRTQERTVSSVVVQNQYVILDSLRVSSGVYLAHTGLHLIQIAASSPQNGTSTGFWWLYNPSSTVKVALKSVEMETAEVAANTTATSPRVVLEGFTYTGTPGGAAIASHKVDSGFAAATALLMSTQVTSVVTLTQIFFATLVSCVQSGSSGGPAPPGQILWQPREDEQPVLNQNEGIVCYQADAGTATTDGRHLITNICWNEYTVP